MNILWKLHNNSILTGILDYYCLACECHINSEQEAFHHTQNQTHISNIRNLPLVEKFQDDKIYKTKKNYYCIFCNEIISTIQKVGIHVTDYKHFNNKGSQLIYKNDGLIIADGVIISIEAWNGIVDNTCVICNIEFENEQQHMNDGCHKLKLVQYDCEFGNKSIYRNIDEDTFLCLTCGTMHPKSEKQRHHELQRHINIYYTSRDYVINPSKPQNAQILESQRRKANESNQVIIETMEVDVKNENSNVKKVNKKPRKKKLKIMRLITDVEVQPEPILESDPYELDIKIQNYLRTSYFVVRGNDKGWCLLCDQAVDDYERHINQSRHLTCYKKHRERLAKLVSSNTEKMENLTIDLQREISQHKPDEPRAPKRKKGKKPVDEKLRAAIKAEYFDSELSSDEDNENQILEDFEFYINNDINIDLIKQIVQCNKCKKHLKFDQGVIRTHIKTHKKMEEINTVNIERCNSVMSIPWYEYPSIKITENGAHCLLCEIIMTTEHSTITEHLKSNEHCNKISNETGTLNKTLLKEFITTISRIEHYLCKDIVINNKFVVTKTSFMFNMKSEFDICCAVCEVDLSSDQLYEHNASEQHMHLVSETYVVTAYANEFIREIKPNIYHCGYCNILADWNNIERHLTTPEHDEARTTAEWSLERYKPFLQNSRVKEVHSVIRLCV